MRSVVAAIGVLAAGCLNHALPRDLAVERVVPPVVRASELPHELRVVTFNVHMEDGAKLARAIAGDAALRDADLIILEEVHRDGVGCSAACVIGRELGYYSVYAPGHRNDVHGAGDDGVAILSRAPIMNAEVIELPHFDVHVNSGRRIAMVATIEREGVPVTVYAVHLENRLTVKERGAQMLPVLRDAEARTTKVIIGGDFNTSPFTWLAHLVPILTTTQPRRLEELVRAHGLDTPVTSSGATHHLLGMRLDAIYTRGFQTTELNVADASDVSDHLALWAVMR